MQLLELFSCALVCEVYMILLLNHTLTSLIKWSRMYRGLVDWLFTTTWLLNSYPRIIQWIMDIFSCISKHIQFISLLYMCFSTFDKYHSGSSIFVQPLLFGLLKPFQSHGKDLIEILYFIFLSFCRCLCNLCVCGKLLFLFQSC